MSTRRSMRLREKCLTPIKGLPDKSVSTPKSVTLNLSPGINASKKLQSGVDSVSCNITTDGSGGLVISLTNQNVSRPNHKIQYQDVYSSSDSDHKSSDDESIKGLQERVEALQRELKKNILLLRKKQGKKNVSISAPKSANNNSTTFTGKRGRGRPRKIPLVASPRPSTSENHETSDFDIADSFEKDVNTGPSSATCVPQRSGVAVRPEPSINSSTPVFPAKCGRGRPRKYPVTPIVPSPRPSTNSDIGTQNHEYNDTSLYVEDVNKTSTSSTTQACLISAPQVTCEFDSNLDDLRVSLAESDVERALAEMHGINTSTLSNADVSVDKSRLTQDSCVDSPFKEPQTRQCLSPSATLRSAEPDRTVLSSLESVIPLNETPGGSEEIRQDRIESIQNEIVSSDHVVSTNSSQFESISDNLITCNVDTRRHTTPQKAGMKQNTIDRYIDKFFIRNSPAPSSEANVTVVTPGRGSLQEISQDLFTADQTSDLEIHQVQEQCNRTSSKNFSDHGYSSGSQRSNVIEDPTNTCKSQHTAVDTGKSSNLNEKSDFVARTSSDEEVSPTNVTVHDSDSDDLFAIKKVAALCSDKMRPSQSYLSQRITDFGNKPRKKFRKKRSPKSKISKGSGNASDTNDSDDASIISSKSNADKINQSGKTVLTPSNKNIDISGEPEMSIKHAEFTELHNETVQCIDPFNDSMDIALLQVTDEPRPLILTEKAKQFPDDGKMSIFKKIVAAKSGIDVQSQSSDDDNITPVPISVRADNSGEVQNKTGRTTEHNLHDRVTLPDVNIQSPEINLTTVARSSDLSSESSDSEEETELDRAKRLIAQRNAARSSSEAKRNSPVNQLVNEKSLNSGSSSSNDGSSSESASELDGGKRIKSKSAIPTNPVMVDISNSDSSDSSSGTKGEAISREHNKRRTPELPQIVSNDNCLPNLDSACTLKKKEVIGINIGADKITLDITSEQVSPKSTDIESSSSASEEETELERVKRIIAARDLATKKPNSDEIHSIDSDDSSEDGIEAIGNPPSSQNIKHLMKNTPTATVESDSSNDGDEEIFHSKLSHSKLPPDHSEEVEFLMTKQMPAPREVSSSSDEFTSDSDDEVGPITAPSSTAPIESSGNSSDSDVSPACTSQIPVQYSLEHKEEMLSDFKEEEGEDDSELWVTLPEHMDTFSQHNDLFRPCAPSRFEEAIKSAEVEGSKPQTPLRRTRRSSVADTSEKTINDSEADQSKPPPTPLRRSRRNSLVPADTPEKVYTPLKLTRQSLRRETSEEPKVCDAPVKTPARKGRKSTMVMPEVPEELKEEDTNTILSEVSSKTHLPTKTSPKKKKTGSADDEQCQTNVESKEHVKDMLNDEIGSDEKETLPLSLQLAEDTDKDTSQVSITSPKKSKRKRPMNNPDKDDIVDDKKKPKLNAEDVSLIENFGEENNLEKPDSDENNDQNVEDNKLKKKKKKDKKVHNDDSQVDRNADISETHEPNDKNNDNDLSESEVQKVEKVKKHKKKKDDSKGIRGKIPDSSEIRKKNKDRTHSSVLANLTPDSIAPLPEHFLKDLAEVKPHSKIGNIGEQDVPDLSGKKHKKKKMKKEHGTSSYISLPAQASTKFGAVALSGLPIGREALVADYRDKRLFNSGIRRIPTAKWLAIKKKTSVSKKW